MKLPVLNHKFLLLFIFLVGTGFLLFLRARSIDRSGEKQSEAVVWLSVDLGGGVVTPGLYNLPDGSRVNDALIKAGGLSADADTERVAREINLAEFVRDGQKIYVPKKESREEVSGLASTRSVNINSASAAELEALEGIGPVRAQKIISDRPYRKPEELVTRKILPSSIFQAIKSRLTL